MFVLTEQSEEKGYGYVNDSIEIVNSFLARSKSETSKE